MLVKQTRLNNNNRGTGSGVVRETAPGGLAAVGRQHSQSGVSKNTVMQLVLVGEVGGGVSTEAWT